ncbi:hypothetical protein, partial [Micrococcus luteus]|uniref:hypothetical protein n=1 Tax=Micrococcus luteus TaxID=1270 RepID=UPI001C92D692
EGEVGEVGEGVERGKMVEGGKGVVEEGMGVREGEWFGWMEKRWMEGGVRMGEVGEGGMRL